MRKLIFLFIVSIVHTSMQAQQADKSIDVATSRKILNMLPLKMKDQNANTNKDRISDAKGKMGMTIRREYGAANNNIYIEVINKSLSINTVNTLLTQGVNAANQYSIADINGYKAIVQKYQSESGKLVYEVLLPMSATLLSLKAPGYSQVDVVTMAKTIPVEKIAKLVE